MKVVFRADASVQIGTGHLIRCRTLANELRRRGAAVRFVCRAHSGDISSLIEADGFHVDRLPAPSGLGSWLDQYAEWLGVSEDEDAADTIRVIQAEADCVVVDHYALGERWEALLRPYVGNLVAIDDLATRRHTCDLLVDQNFRDSKAGPYSDLVPPDCQLLLGPRFALLRPEYRCHQPRLRGPVCRILVFFGGVDHVNATGLALEALSSPELAHLDLDVVVGPANTHRGEIEKLAQQRGRITLHAPQPHLAELMTKADLAVGAGGGTTWERLCMGVPSLLIAIAENQIPAARALAAAGLVEYAGTFEGLAREDLAAKIIAMIQHLDRLRKMTESGALLVDGFGAPRVAEAIMPSDVADLSLRVARPGECGLYYSWANDPEVRQQSLTTDEIPFSTHQKWFSARLTDKNSRLFVLENAANLPVGQIRFDLGEDRTARLSYLLDPLVRGRGWARRLVRLGLDRLAQEGRFNIRAEVKESNPASFSVFERLGFRLDVADRGVRLYRAEISEILSERQ